MDKDNLNISNLETYLYSIINKKVSANTYAGTLPDTTKESWTDMCLIDCGNIKDYNAFGKGNVLIWLYAKPHADGSKNTALLSKLEKKLNAVIDKVNNHTYQINRSAVYPDYDSDRKWHCNIVLLNVTIY